MARLGVDLLQQARQLARLEPKRPRQSSLRRSASASYYALFHFLSEEATRLTIGAGPRLTPLRHLAARSLVHSRMNSLCAEFIRPSPEHKLLSAITAPFTIVQHPSLTITAGTFRKLQKLRHQADYDLNKVFTRNEVLEAADLCEAAIQSWRHLLKSAPDLAHLFAVCLLLWPSLAAH